MFTGLIEEVGIIAAVAVDGGARRITVRAAAVMDDLKIDHSIALDGCCQTVVAVGNGEFTVVAVEETLKKTTLGDFTVGRSINLERAMQAGARLGGHFVQGHVDSVGRVAEVVPRTSSWLYRIEYPDEFASLVIPVGSIAVNGVSLTAAEVSGASCTLSIIPHTYQVTTFRNLKAGDRVNVEFDMIGKYIRNFMPGANRQGLTLERLRELGY